MDLPHAYDMKTESAKNLTHCIEKEKKLFKEELIKGIIRNVERGEFKYEHYMLWYPKYKYYKKEIYKFLRDKRYKYYYFFGTLYISWK